MNIFVLDTDPNNAAQYQADKHVTKMVLETAQLLCSAFPVGAAPYKRTHYNHPCAVWTRATSENFRWAAIHGMALADEYEYRYGRRHASSGVILWCLENFKQSEVPQGGLTDFAQAMPDQYKQADPVAAYRAYYRGGKANIATWRKARPAPAWWAPVVA